MGMTAFVLDAVLSLNSEDFDNGLKDAESKASGLGSKLKTAGKIIGGAVTAGAAAVGKLAKGAVDAYGEFQQLEGGIQTLFGKDAQKMMNNASKAFKTAGVSANQYMEMAIQSSASMISSLNGDTEEAARLMDQSIIDMSDNVNKMGTTMEAVQNAYRGFSRGNFTMLDNLALGYAGTKEGMKELLADATRIAKEQGKNVEYSIDSYADMVEAIHVVQQEMGITGTTAKEAGDTITGSAGSAKAAWEDLKVALASGDDERLTNSLDNFINSVTVMGENIIPIFERALEGIGNMIEKIVPIISEKLPGLVERILPGLLSAATSLVNGVVKALPSILKVLIQQIPKIAKDIFKAIRDIIPQLIKLAGDLIKEFSKAFSNPSTVSNVITEVVGFLNEIITAILDNIDLIIDAGMKILEGLIQGISTNIPKIVDAIILIMERLLQAITDHLPQILEAGVEIIRRLVRGIVDNLPKIIDAIIQLFHMILETIMENLPQILEAGIQILLELVRGIIEAIPELIAAIPKLITALVDTLANGETIGRLLQAGLDLLLGLIAGFLDFGSHITDMIGDLLAAIGNAVVGAGAALLEVGKNVVMGIFEGIKNAWGVISSFIDAGLEALLGKVSYTTSQLDPEVAAKIAQNHRNRDLYGSAYGATGREDYASSNSMAERELEKQRKSNADKQRDNAIQTASHYAPTSVTVTLGSDTTLKTVNDASRKNNNYQGKTG